MTNPTPRPVLRKAGDADVHPAAPRPTRSPRSRTAPRTDTPSSEPAPAPVAALPAPEEKSAAKKAPAKPHTAAPATPSKRRERKFSGNTSDHMRVAESADNVDSAAPAPSAPRSAPKPAPKPAADAPAAAAQTAPAVPAAPAQPAKAAEPSAAPARASKSAGAELLKGKSVELEVQVPKALRKAARAEAKKRGLDIDTVVVDLLHAWLTDPR